MRAIIDNSKFIYEFSVIFYNLTKSIINYDRYSFLNKHKQWFTYFTDLHKHQNDEVWQTD